MFLCIYTYVYVCDMCGLMCTQSGFVYVYECVYVRVCKICVFIHYVLYLFMYVCYMCVYVYVCM